MKRILAFMLTLLLLLSFCLSGCTVMSRGSDYCYRFLDNIMEGSYEDAFEMIAESIKEPEPTLSRAEKRAARKAEKEAAKAAKLAAKASASPEDENTPAPDDAAPSATPNPAEETTLPDDALIGTPIPTITPDTTQEGNPTPEAAEETPAPDAEATPSPAPTAAPSPTPQLDEDGNPIIAKMISRKDFIEKYTSIFEELQLESMEYTVTDVTDGEAIAIIKYDLTYHSGRGGDLTYSFEMTANRIEYRWVIDWSPALIFPLMDWGDNVRVGILQANRGEILCDGEPYAQNVNVITVFAVPSSMIEAAQAAAKEAGLTEEQYPSTQEIYETFARQVAAIPEMETTAADVVKALNKQINNFAKLKTFFPDEMDYNLEQTLLAIKGLSIDTANYGTLRYYPFGESLCHIVGYAGIVTKEEMKAFEAAKDTRYNGDSWTGKYGLERVYEDRLLGANGRFTYIQDSTGGSKGMLYKTDAVDGEDLHLTINPELQERLEDVIDITVYDSEVRGAVVVLNPQTGAILASCSFPGFDLNYLARGVPEEEWEAMENDSINLPLYNRVTQGMYTPGSTFKTMTAAALLETNTMWATDVFPASEAVYIHGDEWMPSETFMASLSERADPAAFAQQAYDRPLRRTGNSNRHTPMNLLNSIIDSDNLFFAYGALRIGWSKYEAYMDKIGWMTKIPLEVQPGTYDDVLETEKQLEVSQPQLYDKTKKQYDYDLAVTGYGQGQIMMSPLHLACYISAYANNGAIMQPYLVDSIWHSTGTDYTLVEQRQPKVWKYALQESTVQTLLPALRQVCVDGTARRLTSSFISKRIFTSLGYTFAGKTGTAEITDDKSKELAWFVCWRDGVSAEEARLVCIMLEVNLVNGKIPASGEIAQMKYDIARAVLREDTIN